jgi:hypothetical protein
MTHQGAKVVINGVGASLTGEGHGSQILSI